MKDLSGWIHLLEYTPHRLVRVDLTGFGVKNSQFYIYLDNLNHPMLSGNKLRKLYANIEFALANNYKTIITIGGNFSNYLHACSFIPELTGLNVVAIIKGHEPKIYGSLLKELRDREIPMYFFPRKDLKENSPTILSKLSSDYPNSIIIPEGGNNELAHIGFSPLVKNHFDWVDKLCVGVGTGSTYRSMLQYKSPNTKLIGYAAVNDFSLEGEIQFEYTLGGFAKMNDELLQFAEEFKIKTTITLDPIYTTKMIYGIIEDYKKGRHLPDEKIVAIHTGGLQGWNGMRNASIILND